MLNITLLKCNDLKKELELEETYRSCLEKLYEQIDVTSPSSNQQVIEAEDKAFEIALQLDLNVAGVSDRKIFVVKKDGRYLSHPFNVGSFYNSDDKNSFNATMVELKLMTLEEIFNYSEQNLIDGFYLKFDLNTSLNNVNMMIDRFTAIGNHLPHYSWFIDALKIIKITIELVLRQSDRDNYYLQWIYNEA